ncbi:MAG TPA: FAD-dependent oxidoreductase, partial [Mycobacteriales bacterium]|nr:FAD-dependent oxidoreductase [Mycobacteriales bacterium]
MTAPQILVVGNGMVGHRTAEALHARGVTRTHQVLVLGDEPHPAYDRVHLSRALTGDHHDLYLAQDSFYDQPGLARRVGTPVTRLDRPAQEVVLADGSRLRYDALVLATGSHPFVPPISGAQAPHVLVYRTLEDVLALRHAAATARSAVVIGGGLLGLEAAGGLRDLGLTVAVVEVADRLMARQVDEGGGAVLRRLVTDRGVAVHVGGGVASVDTDRVTLTDGSTVTADLVVVAAGIRPRDE